MSIDDGWQSRGRCVQERWKPETIDLVTHGKGSQQDKQRTAEEMCSGCPVVSQCARMALRTGASGVVYAGVNIPDNCYSQSKSVTARLMYAEEYNAIPTSEQLDTFMADRSIPNYAKAVCINQGN